MIKFGGWLWATVLETADPAIKVSTKTATERGRRMAGRAYPEALRISASHAKSRFSVARLDANDAARLEGTSGGTQKVLDVAAGLLGWLVALDRLAQQRLRPGRNSPSERRLSPRTLLSRRDSWQARRRCLSPGICRAGPTRPW